jgi:hypothetical protein
MPEVRFTRIGRTKVLPYLHFKDAKDYRRFALNVAGTTVAGEFTVMAGLPAGIGAAVLGQAIKRGYERKLLG